jgi:hypothetical protein
MAQRQGESQYARGTYRIAPFLIQWAYITYVARSCARETALPECGRFRSWKSDRGRVTRNSEVLPLTATGARFLLRTTASANPLDADALTRNRSRAALWFSSKIFQQPQVCIICVTHQRNVATIGRWYGRRSGRIISHGPLFFPDDSRIALQGKIEQHGRVYAAAS